jgi:hypothetical protein
MPEIKGAELVHKYNHYLSFSDIATLDVCKGGKCENLPPEQLEEIMWDNGIDIKRPYQIVYDTHRNLQNQVVTTNKLVGFFREDPEWTDRFGVTIDTVLDKMNSDKKYQGGDYTKKSTSAFPEGDKKTEKALKQDAKNYNQIKKSDIAYQRKLENNN